MFLSVKGLQVHYAARQRAAVMDVSLGLDVGQIGVLIGPSGCGKTTLLRAVAGLEPVSAGSIDLADEVVSAPGRQVAPEQRRVGMVFQDYALFPHLNVARNVGFGLDRLARSEREQRIAEALELVGLQGSGERYPHELSGGQQQRVALARALAPRPRLLLLDEPFSSLDVDLRERLAFEVRGILKAAQATALFVTHDQMEAFAIGDVIGVMHEGRLHQWADAYELYHRPATRFVADFIGHGVFAPARLRQQGHSLLVDTPLGTLSEVLQPEAPEAGLQQASLPCMGPGLAADGGEECEILLRADDIVHDDDAPVKAEIIRKAFRGSEFLYTLRLQSGQTVLAHVPSHHDHKLGEWIGIRAQVDHVVTFRRDCPVTRGEMCQMPCAALAPPAANLLPSGGGRAPAQAVVFQSSPPR